MKDNQFKKGNQFWKQRITHGRNTDYTPETILDAFFDYVEWTNKNPFEKVEHTDGKNGKVIKIKTLKRPLSREKFILYLGKANKYLHQLKQSKKHDFSTVLEWIENYIDSEQFEGAAVGIFSPNIIARKLNLAEKIEHENKQIHPTEIKVGFK